MLFEGEINNEKKQKKGKWEILKIKIETSRNEYEIDLSYRRKYFFLIPLVLIFCIFFFDWLSLKLKSRGLELIYNSFYEDSTDGLIKRISDLKKEVNKLKTLNESLLSLVFGGDEVYPDFVSANFEDDYILQSIGVVSESLKLVYNELQKEREALGHLPTLWPVKGRVTSGFGYRISPIEGNYQFHSGIDISVPEGTPVLASASGKVIEVGRNELNGLYLRIRHINGITTTYAHLKKVFVSKGDYVKKGEVVGLVGLTGRTTGSHLHFEISFKGRPVDPLMFLVQD